MERMLLRYILHVLVCVSASLNVAIARNSFNVRCATGSINFSDLQYTPCGELAKQIGPAKCVSKGECTLTVKSTPCKRYVKDYPGLVYQCSRKVVPSNGPRLSGKFGGFQNSISSCTGTTDLVRRAIDSHNRGPRNRKNKYRIPSEEDKIAVRGLIRSIRVQHWNNVKTYAGRIGARACRMVISGDDILAIEGETGRDYNGIILYFRLNARKPLVLEAAHANLGGPDSGTLEQTARLFQNSKIMAALIPGYARWSSATKDLCQPSRFVTDNAHSTENLFFHAEVGIKESFTGSRHIQFHRWSGRFEMFISQSIDAQASSNGFLTTFSKAVKNSAGSKFFSTFRTAASSSGTAFETSLATFANTNTGGRLLNGSPRVCQTGSQFRGERFIHVEQTGPSITNTYLWVKSLNSVMKTSLFRSADVFNAKEISQTGTTVTQPPPTSPPSRSPPSTPAPSIAKPPNNRCGTGRTFNWWKCISCTKALRKFSRSSLKRTVVRQRLERDCSPRCEGSRSTVVNLKCRNCDTVLMEYRDARYRWKRAKSRNILELMRSKGKCKDIPLSKEDCGEMEFVNLLLKCI